MNSVVLKKKVTPKSRGNKKYPLMLTWMLILFIILFIVSFCLGRYAIPLPDLLSILGNSLFGLHNPVSAAAVTIVYSVRLPRIIAASLIGGALATAGATYQGLFRNPMVSPDLLGASAGAGFGATMGLMFSFSLIGVSTLAFIVGLCAVALSYGISVAIGKGGDTILLLVLTGMVVSSMFSAFTSIIKYVADPDNKLPAITFWLMGGLSTITMANILMLLPPLLVGFIPIFLLRWKINVLSFGEEEAQTMGVNTKRLRLVFIVCATLLTAASVAVSGMIGWVGLIIPHMARLFVGPNYKRLMPASLLCGAIFLIVADDVARTAFAAEIPLGILTSLIGAPFFIFLLFRGRRKSV